MNMLSKSRANRVERDDRILKSVGVGLAALVFLGAAAESRNTILDRSAGRPEPSSPTVSTPTDAQMIRDMLSHD